MNDRMRQFMHCPRKNENNRLTVKNYIFVLSILQFLFNNSGSVKDIKLKSTKKNNDKVKHNINQTNPAISAKIKTRKTKLRALQLFQR